MEQHPIKINKVQIRNPVSYTHLDVYKRQTSNNINNHLKYKELWQQKNFSRELKRLNSKVKIVKTPVSYTHL